ncbi:hypothetical protein [Xenorhabdus bovienii]|uniref:hypothetical protein n=1 Tax=Xenorhabdus bovienii TaxID=40576 RepID=UPI0004D3474F|nr:hypothetical protein [Xenorhabdus bovienii]CDG88100.1 hypothetical protein XBFFR1_2020026 [Xenorhabdus bovienii str. feltiae France]CDG91602.1 hypothetical protein XBFFL1_1680006 [Xenorhabdus bovienii str. feltiae Florida]
MTTHNYIKQLKLLNTQIEASLRYIENVRLLKGEAEADTFAENDLKSLLSYHSQKLLYHYQKAEESQRQQHRVIALDCSRVSFGQDISNATEKLILKRARVFEEYPVTWIIQLGAKGVLFSRVTNGRIDEDYAPVNRQKANVYASAILNEFEPPKGLQLSDMQTIQRQSE